MIKRVIYIDNESEIDFENVGVHFTGNMNYSHTGGGGNGATIERALKVTFFVENYNVFGEATAISNEGYSSEKEIVLLPSQNLIAEVHFQRWNSLGGYSRPYKVEKKNINIGTRMDQWVKKLI
jgi:hypothetical protein